MLAIVLVVAPGASSLQAPEAVVKGADAFAQCGDYHWSWLAFERKRGNGEQVAARRTQPPPISRIMTSKRDWISSAETSSWCVMIIHTWPKGSRSFPARSPQN